MMYADSVNQPFRLPFLVCVGPGGRYHIAQAPIKKVRDPANVSRDVWYPIRKRDHLPSRANSHRQPARPATPRMLRKPAARKAPRICVPVNDTQNHESRMVSSFVASH